MEQELILNEHIDRLEHQLQLSFRSIATIINYNLTIRKININPFLQSSNNNHLPPRELIDQLKLNLNSFDAILQHIQSIVTMSIAITKRDLNDQIHMKIDPQNDSQVVNQHENDIQQESQHQPTIQQEPELEILNHQPITTHHQTIDLTSQSPSPQPIQPIPTQKSPTPIEIDSLNQSSPETPLNKIPTNQKPSPTSPKPSTTEPPGTTNPDFKSTSDLTDGDLFGDGSLFGSSHHGSVVPSPLNQHAHVIPPTTIENDHHQPIQKHQPHDQSTIIIPSESSNQTQEHLENQATSSGASDLEKIDKPSDSTTIPQPQQQLPQPQQQHQLSTSSSDHLSVPVHDPSNGISNSSSINSTGTLTEAVSMDITSQADLSAFLSSFSQPSSAAHSSGPSGSSSPTKQTLEQNTIPALIGLGIDLSFPTSSSLPITNSHHLPLLSFDHHPSSEPTTSLATTVVPSSDVTLAPSSTALNLPPSTLSTTNSNGIDFSSIFATMDPKPPPPPPSS